MSLPQGIDFRATSGYVTDPADHTYEISITANYPRTTAQGNNVGWETVSDSRNRSTSPDARLAGIHRTTGTTVTTYRIDLPATGDYKIRLAAGDYSYSAGIKVEIFDTTTSLGIIADTSTTASQRFRDATDAEHTAANWPANNASVTKTFASTILRAKVGDTAGGGGVIACLYVEAASTTHTAAYPDSATPVDTQTATLITATALGESATALDAISAALVTSAAYAETAATADAYTATLVVAGQSEYSDTATALDAITAALVTSTAWADAAVPVDSIAAALVAQSAYADSAAPADSYDATLVSGGTSSYADQATPVDAYTAVFIARADYADACTAQDLYAGALAGEADPALRQSIYLRLADQAPFVRLSDQSPIAKL